jgi:hypothetical protein
MTALWLVAPEMVATVKVALPAPAATVTLAGTVAAPVLPLDSATTKPSAAAAPLRVTVPVAEVPPLTVAGFSDTVATVTAGGVLPDVVMVSRAWRDELLVPARILTVWLEPLTRLVLTVKLVLVLPAGIVTLPGTVASAGFSLKRLTTRPPAGAALPNVTRPVDELPPATVAGVRLSEARLPGAGLAGGFTLIVCVRCTPPAAAVIIENCPSPELFCSVVTLKLVELAPAGTVMLAGTVAQRVSLLDNAIVTPPDGAGPARLTDPIEGLPPSTVVGLSARAASAPGGISCNTIRCVPPRAARMLTCVV